MTATPLSPQLISQIRRANTVVFHQVPDQLDAELVIHLDHDTVVYASADSCGIHASGAGKQLAGLRQVSKLHRYDMGLSSTIWGLLRQGDTLRVWTRLGNQSFECDGHVQVLVEQYLIIKRRARETDGAGGGKELRFLIDAGTISVAQAQSWEYVAL